MSDKDFKKFITDSLGRYWRWRSYLFRLINKDSINKAHLIVKDQGIIRIELSEMIFKKVDESLKINSFLRMEIM